MENEDASDLGSLHPELAPLEAMLSSLAPRAARIDRDRLMFLAGQASAQMASGERRPPVYLAEQIGVAQANRSRWTWPAAFAGMTAAAAALLVLLVNRPEPRVIERIVRVPIEAQRAFASQSRPGGVETTAFDDETPSAARRPRLAAGESYVHSRDQALAFGIDAWLQRNPAHASAGDGAASSYRALREDLLQ